MTMRHAITAGFVPLLDSALLVVAHEMGFAEEQGIALTLLRERSWASIRDRLAVRHIDVAHILGPMPIAGNLGWCEVPADRNYNRPVRIPYRASHETMRRGDRLYDYCLVLDWNISPRRRGRGSAIFFHLARPGFTPTQGCVAVTARVMARLLPWLSDRTVLEVKR